METKPFSEVKCDQLGLSDLFQTFEDLESVVDKEAEIANIRELLDKDDVQQNDEKEPLC